MTFTIVVLESLEKEVEGDLSNNLTCSVVVLERLAKGGFEGDFSQNLTFSVVSNGKLSKGMF